MSTTQNAVQKSLQSNLFQTSLDNYGIEPAPINLSQPSTKKVYEKNSDYIIIALIVSAICLFWVWIFYSLYTNNLNTKYFLVCDPGKCATSIYNGEKRCPELVTSSIAYDPSFEVCNSRFACENTTTPFALGSNGATNTFGSCDSGSICRCLNKPQCSYDTSVIFTVNGGVVGNFADASSRATIRQTPGSYGNIGNQTLDYPESNVSFCQIKLSRISRVVPRTSQCTFETLAPTIGQYRTCINSNPCVVGRLAFKPINVDSFSYTAQNIEQVPVGCVPNLNGLGDEGPICTGLRVPVFNSQTGGIICK